MPRSPACGTCPWVGR
ncbi:hypothetical protein ACIQMR_13935 [Streptomyces sp. NPDC091376]